MTLLNAPLTCYVWDNQELKSFARFYLEKTKFQKSPSIHDFVSIQIDFCGFFFGKNKETN